MAFDSVIHVLVGEQAQYQFDTDFFIICLPPLERITIFDDYKDTPLNAQVFDIADWTSQTRSVESHRGLINLQYQALDKTMILMSDRSWVETQILRQIFLITQWLDSAKANYCIVNVSKNLDKNNRWGPSGFLLDYCLSHPRCRLFDHALYDVNLDVNEPADYAEYGWFGHHGPDGNKLFFEKSVKDLLC